MTQSVRTPQSTMSSPLESQSTEAPDGFTPLVDQKNQMNEPESTFASSSSSDRKFHRRSIDMPATKRIAFVSNNLDNLLYSLLCHILSFLPIKVAATTSTLSKRWRSVFAFAPTLLFRCDEGDDKLVFMEFVNRVLELRGKAILEKFSLDIAENLDGDLVDGWIRWALKCNVTELEIQVYDVRNSGTSSISPGGGVPSSVLLSNSLIVRKQ